MFRQTLIAFVLATPALADFPETVQHHILPGYALFAKTTQALEETAMQTCEVEALRPEFQAAFDAWMRVQHLHFGPVEDKGRRLAIAFWPDPKGSGIKAQRALLAGDPALLAGDRFAEQSVAVRGLMGLERLLYPTEVLVGNTCELIRATTIDLATIACDVNDDWITGYAETVLTAGDDDNTVFLTRQEVRQVLFTQLVTGIESLSDERLRRPLGTFDKPRPERAEARASGRSLTNIRQAIGSMRDMADTLTPDAPLTIAAFDRALALADELDDPIFAGIVDPAARLEVEILQQSLTELRKTMLLELAPELDVGVGFNAADGD